MQRILALDPGTYQRHAIHHAGRTWAETNCYVDVWIELLHSLGFEPVAALPFTVALDFEGDQWTFFKFPLHDLRELYGLDVQELAVWRPLIAHVEEQVARGRPVLVELDSFFLPDTAGAAYRKAHVKSTVAVNEVDVAGRRLGYFHNQAYYHLDGDDFVDVLRLRDAPDPAILPPYVEFVRVLDRATLDAASQLRRSLLLLGKHLSLAPKENPFVAFKARFENDLPWLLGETMDTFHQYSFATLRQFGACYELSQTYLQWLARQGEAGLEEQIGAFREISEGAKVLQFQLARSVARRKPLDLSAIDAMAGNWETGVRGLRARYS